MTDTLAFLFPGQGSQQVGMLADYVAEPVVADTLAEASDVLQLDLLSLFQNGPADKLNQTAITQPALLVASVALWRLWASRTSVRPKFLAGHSLGEYSALVCAGSIAFADAVSLVNKRGLYMQEAVAAGEGAMAAVLGLDDQVVLEACKAVAEGQVVEAANFNAPGQVVIAGHVAAVELAVERAKAEGARKAILLPVSVPSHCALMKPAAQKLADELTALSVSVPSIPVLHNVSADVRADEEGIRQHLVAQLYSPVRWVETITTLVESQVTHFVECGPGKVLAGLNKRIARRIAVTPVASLSAMDSLLVMLEKGNNQE